MEERLARIIYDYAKRNQRMDENFFQKVLEIIIETEQLHPYIVDCQIKEKSSNGADASYNSFTKVIKIYAKDTIKTIESYQKNWYSEVPTTYPYWQLVQILLHETNHVEQEKKKKEEQTIESQLLCIESLVEDQYEAVQGQGIPLQKEEKKRQEKIIKRQNKYYDYSPCERMAEMDACDTAQRIAACLNQPTMMEWMLARYYDEQIRGYDYNWRSKKQKTLKIPTKNYFEKVDQGNDRWEMFIRQIPVQELDIQKRIRFGLQASEDELKELVEKIILHQKQFCELQNQQLIKRVKQYQKR